MRVAPLLLRLHHLLGVKQTANGREVSNLRALSSYSKFSNLIFAFHLLSNPAGQGFTFFPSRCLPQDTRSELLGCKKAGGVLKTWQADKQHCVMSTHLGSTRWGPCLGGRSRLRGQRRCTSFRPAKCEHSGCRAAQPPDLSAPLV